jgi:hypothetical protein
LSDEYRTFTKQLAADAASGSHGLRVANPFAWLSGTWTWHGQPVTFAVTPYGVALGPNPFLIFNASVRMWVLAVTDPDSYGILVGLPPKQGRVRFSGLINIAGEMVELRQTWHLIDNDNVDIENERREGNLWTLWDRARLERVQPALGDWTDSADSKH